MVDLAAGGIHHLARYDGSQVAPRSSLTMFGGWATGGAPVFGTMRRVVDGAGQTHHIAFRAGTADELGAWQDHLRSMGVQTSDIVTTPFFRSVQFRAPDGLLMELSTDGTAANE